MGTSSYIDAVGELDGTHCPVDWKTTSSGSVGLLSLAPQSNERIGHEAASQLQRDSAPLLNLSY